MTRDIKDGNGGVPTRFNRRQFLKTSAFLGGTAVLSQAAAFALPDSEESYAEYPLNRADHQIYSVCLQCHTSCPIKVKILDGVAVKMDGNPYAAQTMFLPVPLETPPEIAAQVDGKICPKGQSGIQSLYDPYRITKVLKRSGRRGEDKWKVILFEQAISEIVEGGLLFTDVPGEEDRLVPGLKDIFKLRDPKLSKAMASDSKNVGKGKMSVESFKEKYRDHLDFLIDPDHPDFGPVNNEFVFLAGRIEHGRKEFSKRWLSGGFGSINWYEHTTICEQSHHIAYEKMTDQYIDGKWKKGKHHMKPDLYESEFVIFFGTGAFEANFGPPHLTEVVTDGLASGRLKIAVVDPRLSKTAAKAWKWMPIKPGGDAALAYAMILWIIENEAYDGTYLTNANKAAAKADNETTWTNSSWLVRIEEDGPGKFLRASDVGMGDEHTFLVMNNGSPAAVKPSDSKNAVEGDLFYSGEVKGIRVKTAFQILSEYAASKTLSEWAEESGLDEDMIVEVTKEFVKHGKKSVAELYRGPVQHTNGYYNAQAIITLNLLLGNADWKGGLSVGGSHWHESGSKGGQPFNLKKSLHPGKLSSFGHKVNREKTKYEDSTLFREHGYPAKRPWYPHTGNLYQEVLPAADVGYPYSIKALFLHKGSPAYASPAGHKIIDTLMDTSKIPLFFSCDIVIAETSMYSDYLFPDSAIWERWGTPHTTPAVPVKASKLRQPTVEPLVERVRAYGEEVPISMEAIMLAIAEKLGMPGHGEDGFGPGMDLKRGEDYYMKMFANLAAGDKPGEMVPDASEEEMELFFAARKHLSSVVFDKDKLEKASVDDQKRNWWKKVVYMLNRGGRFEDIDAYLNSGDKVPHKFKKMFNLYVEAVAATRHPYTGKRFSGVAPYEPVMAYDGSVITDEEYPIRLITYKEIVGGQSRTSGNHWLAMTMPENTILMHPSDGRGLGLDDGDTALVVSASNPEGVWDLKNGKKIRMEGKVQLVQGMRPGVAAVSWHFGHWAYGANDASIDGEMIKGEEMRGTGLCTNAAMRVDPALKNVCLTDIIGGSSSFYDTNVKLIKA